MQVYANAITDKTRLLMVCHIINNTGHILPVRKIADMAHARGVPNLQAWRASQAGDRVAGMTR